MSEPGRCLPHRRWRRDDLPPVAGCGFVLWFLVPCDLMNIREFCRICRIFRPFTGNQKVLTFFFLFSDQNLAVFLGTVEMMVPDPCQEMAQAGKQHQLSWCNTGWTSRIYTKLKAPIICSWVEYILIFVCVCVFFFSVALNQTNLFFWGGRWVFFFFRKICLLWFDVSDSDGRWWCSPQAGYYGFYRINPPFFFFRKYGFC